MLLLPELNNATAITGTDSDPVKTGSRGSSPNVNPTLELVNQEAANDSGHISFSNGLEKAKVSVNHLTASWTHVSYHLLIFVSKLYVLCYKILDTGQNFVLGERKIGSRQCEL